MLKHRCSRSSPLSRSRETVAEVQRSKVWGEGSRQAGALRRDPKRHGSGRAAASTHAEKDTYRDAHTDTHRKKFLSNSSEK